MTLVNEPGDQNIDGIEYGSSLFLRRNPVVLALVYSQEFL